MMNIYSQLARSCAKINPGARNTKSEASNLYVNEVFSCPKFMVLDVGRVYPQGWPQRFGVVSSPHVHPDALESKGMVSEFPEGIKTMTTSPARAIAPTPSLADALRLILNEVTPGIRPYSSDSYIPNHLTDQARSALELHDGEASQHAFNALSTAAWHCARGEPAKALTRMRRAQSHIKNMMEGSAT